MATQTSSSPRSTQQVASPYSWYVVFVLIVAYTFSFIDRQILTLLVGPIRETLQISDTQISLLHGLAFALFYSIMGIPIGRMVDSRKRTTMRSAVSRRTSSSFFLHALESEWGRRRCRREPIR